MAGGLLTPALWALAVRGAAREAVAVTAYGEVEAPRRVGSDVRRAETFVQWAELVLGPFPELRRLTELEWHGRARPESAVERVEQMRSGADPCSDLAGFKDVQGHGCDVYTHPGSPDEANPAGKKLCFGGEPRMPIDFYMLFASPTHGNAIDACCSCGKGKDFGQKAWKYPDYQPPAQTCTDLSGWADSEGADCAAYDFQCLDGEAAVPEALILQYKDKFGLSAVDACCKCGREVEDAGCKDLPWHGEGGEQCFWYSARCKDHAPLEERVAYEVDGSGKSALDACCMCGGGTLAACDDLHAWTDNHGDGCAAYNDRCENGWPKLAEQAYVDLAAGPGRAANTPNALDACCVCGGGHGSERSSCTSTAGWMDADGSGCDDYTDTCFHHAPLKERSFYVKVATKQGVSALDSCCKCGGGCADKASWLDAAGYGCEEYAEVCAEGALVLTDGKASPKIEQYAVDSVSAKEACCRCGGGCSSHAAWIDKDGYGCSDYGDICMDGAVKQEESQRVLAAAVEGVSAAEACCACGGSTAKAAMVLSAAVAPAPAPAAALLQGSNCGDEPDWEDSDGYKCSDYYDLCDGGKPLHAIEEYRKYENARGLSALNACCPCGGGEELACQDASWQDRDGYSCTDYSELCAGGGPLFEVEEYHAYADARGTSALGSCCRCGGGERAQCHDEDWADKDGYHCADYNDLCAGGHALFPEPEYKAFADSAGKTAMDACCRCGGGARSTDEAKCADTKFHNADWADKDGYECKDYLSLCKEGKPIWPESEYEKFATNSVTALHACCSCGGGTWQ